jgi:small subunit ribosomal protein S13
MFTYKQYNLSLKKDIRLSLQNIYGIGWLKSIFICSRLGLSYPFSLNSLNIYNYLVLVYVLDFFTWLEVRVKRIIFQNIKNLYKIECYKGFRHKDSLPTRGQRTRTNASTKKRYKIMLDTD